MVTVSLLTRISVDGEDIKSPWPTVFTKEVTIVEPNEIKDVAYYLFGACQTGIEHLLEVLTTSQVCIFPKNSPGISLGYENSPCNTVAHTDAGDVG